MGVVNLILRCQWGTGGEFLSYFFVFIFVSCSFMPRVPLIRQTGSMMAIVWFFLFLHSLHCLVYTFQALAST